MGFHRLGIILCIPLLLVAAVLAFKEWIEPTGSYHVQLPEGVKGWWHNAQSVHDKAIAAMLIADQKVRGLDAPTGLVVVGIESGVERQDNVEWTKFLLRDGRKIGVASTDKKKVADTAIAFLWNEKERGQPYTDNDRMEFDGVRVAFLDWGDQDMLADGPPWPRHRQRQWFWPLFIALCGTGLYIAIRSVAWIIDGFTGSRAVKAD